MTYLEIQTSEISCSPFGESQGILNRQPHIRHSELGFHAAIRKLHHRMNDRLGMHHHFDLFGFHAEQPFGFDHFKPFVHHRSRIDRHLSTHMPVRVFQSIGRSHLFQKSPVFSPERTSGSGQNQFFGFTPALSGQTLEDGRMFRIDRQNSYPMFCDRFVDQFSGYDQSLFVSQSNIFSGFNGIYRRD